MRRLHKFLKLDRSDRRLLVEAAVDLVTAWLLLRGRSFQSVMASLETTADRAPAAEEIARIRWAVELAARHLPLRLTCLPQALAASWMLVGRGVRPSLHYGVARTADGSRFEAHAWVEAQGLAVVGDRDADRFTPLTVFPLPAGDVRGR